MTLPHLQHFAEICARKPVVDHSDKPALHLRREKVDPIKRSLIDWRRVISRVVDKNKFVAIKADKFAAQSHRHGVDQLVGKVHTTERLELRQRLSPLHTIAKPGQSLRLSILPDPEWFDDKVAKSRKEIRRPVASCRQNVAGKLAVMRALLNDDELVDLTEAFPNLRKLRAEPLPETPAATTTSKVTDLP